MFTSRTIMFALLSFLASANACIQCPATINVGDDTMKLSSSGAVGVSDTDCVYSDKSHNQAHCRYTVSTFWILCSLLFSVDMVQANGVFDAGWRHCPLIADVKKKCHTI
ncbi:uncharacterized protein EDB91DRAFT_1147167 [Suillus paluster]|uniref:uncharacterized protein n=1 Tax=Suillus paluster TaxID=48578 RepID=UPI001B8737DD|nr:uncharacterized protein EDB91DRAFT_1147167 [Suillus paluster]KAG1734267.1 hypothetical protein EDB91DRAFT_1147167 [Suillus paluster]